MVSVREMFFDAYKSLETAEHRLLYLFLETSRRCNLSCLHCGSDCRSEEDPAELAPETWLSVIDSVVRRFPAELFFVITGGEPLIYPHLELLADRFRLHGRKWGMVTNGFALTGERLDGLVRTGLSSLTISLDGLAESHTYLRGNPAAYGRALHAISLLAGSTLPLKDVVTCVYPGNLAELSSIAETLVSLRIPHWRLFRIFPHGRAQGRPELALSNGEYAALLGWIEKNRPSCRRAGLTVDLSCEGWVPFLRDRKLRSEPFFCRAGINIASILSDGTITGCANNGPAFHVGNVRTDDFAAVWESGFGKFRRREWMRTGLCAKCAHFHRCRGGSLHLWNDRADSIESCPMREERSIIARGRSPSLPSDPVPRRP